MVATRKKKPTVKKPAPLRLKGSKLEDFLPLLPAEEKLRQCAASGEECIVDDYKDVRPEKTTKLNTVRAEFLRYMILGGCESSPVHVRGINLAGGFIKSGGKLDLEASLIIRDLKLYNCTLDDSVFLSDASTKNISFEGSITKSIVAERATIVGNLQLHKGFTSNEPIRLNNAEISGTLFCEGGIFNDPNIAIIANRAKIDGDVDLENVIAKGTIALTGTEIGGDFTPQKATLEGTPALQLRNTKIGGTLIWRSLGFINGEVDFSGASCKTINTDGDSWMRKREDYEANKPKNEDAQPDVTDPESTQPKATEYNTKLDNFTYEGFSNLPDNCKSEFWIEWLSQQPQDHLQKNFKPRPWEQLAGALDSMGYQEEARDIRIEKQKLQTKFMRNHETSSFTRAYLWHFLQYFYRLIFWGPVVSYGYRPGKALVCLLALVMAGTLIYSQAAKRGIMTPTHPLIFKEARAGGSIPAWCAENWVHFPDETCTSSMPSEYSEFQPFIYAADIALPVVNLRMESDWAPRVVFTDGTRDNFGWWVRTYEWFLIAAGWILSLLFVSAVGSSIRK